LREALAILDEELQRLPEKYRAPIVLCYLEGKTRNEAARLLGWSPGTLHGRLERGRLRLRSRLARRGLAPSAGLLAVILSGETASAVPVILGRSAPRDHFPFGPGSAPVKVVALAEEALRAMHTFRIPAVAALVFVAVVLGTGAGILPW
jgi:hypothetical protein